MGSAQRPGGPRHHRVLRAARFACHHATRPDRRLLDAGQHRGEAGARELGAGLARPLATRSASGVHRVTARAPALAGSPPLASLNSDVRRACHSEEPRGKRGLFALDAATGALRWRVDLGTAPGTHAGTAANADTVFVTEWDAPDGDAANGAPTLRAYDLATGKERWDFAVTWSGDLSKPVGDGTVSHRP